MHGMVSAVIVDLVHFSGIVGHLGLGLEELRAVVPGLVPELVDDFHVLFVFSRQFSDGLGKVCYEKGEGSMHFFCSSVPLIMWHDFFLPHCLSGGIGMRGYDVPAYSAVGEMIEGGEGSG